MLKSAFSWKRKGICLTLPLKWLGKVSQNPSLVYSEVSLRELSNTHLQKMCIVLYLKVLIKLLQSLRLLKRYHPPRDSLPAAFFPSMIPQDFYNYFSFENSILTPSIPQSARINMGSRLVGCGSISFLAFFTSANRISLGVYCLPTEWWLWWKTSG